MTLNDAGFKKLRVFGYDPGKVHRWGAWVDFLHPEQLPEWSGGIEVGPERQDVITALEEAFRGIARDQCVVAVETPAGIPFGATKQEILARGRDMNITSLAAERFASIAWAQGYRVEQLSAHEVRGGRVIDGKPTFQGICLGKSATDAEVRAALEGNLRQVGRCNVHARDAAAAGFVIGTWILARKIRYGADLFVATAEEKAKQKSKSRRTKANGSAGPDIPESLRRALEAQGHGEALKRGVRVL